MDRKGQLRNVAFGGAWSEQIAGDEALAQAMAMLQTAPQRTVDEDLREDLELQDAVWAAALAHPKGDELSNAWRRALNLQIPSHRSQELSRLAGLFAAGLTARLSQQS